MLICICCVLERQRNSTQLVSLRVLQFPMDCKERNSENYRKKDVDENIKMQVVEKKGGNEKGAIGRWC